MSSKLLGTNTQNGETLQHPAASQCIAQKTWDGILHIAHIKSPPIETPELIPFNHHITLMLGDVVDVDIWREGKPSSQRIFPQDLVIDPRGVACRGRLYQPSEALVIELEYKFVERIINESIDVNRIEFISKIGLKDPLLKQITLSLMSEVNTEHCETKLYGEAAATMLVAHLYRHYSIESSSLAMYQGGLPKYKLRRVQDYIQENLSQELRLEELATIAQISTYHFCYLFKQSVGTSPHQYIVQQRIKKAQHLLRETNLRVSEIALEVGYQSCSHFSALFKRHTGGSPGKYRQIF